MANWLCIHQNDCIGLGAAQTAHHKSLCSQEWIRALRSHPHTVSLISRMKAYCPSHGGQETCRHTLTHNSNQNQDKVPKAIETLFIPHSPPYLLSLLHKTDPIYFLIHIPGLIVIFF